VAPVTADTLVNREEFTLNVVFGLIGIIAIILVLGWLANRLKNDSRYSGNSKLKLISQLPVGVKERIAIIDVGSQQIVIGVTATSINKLHVLEDQDRFLSSCNNKKNVITQKDMVVRVFSAIEWFVEKTTKRLELVLKKKEPSVTNSNKTLASSNDITSDESKENFKELLDKCNNVVNIKDKQ
jgi:flagellar biosynthetic protein FliO